MRLILTAVVMALLMVGTASSMDSQTAERIDTAVDELYPSLVECRRWFHAHPELSNREVETAAEIARRLRAMGYEPDDRTTQIYLNLRDKPQLDAMGFTVMGRVIEGMAINGNVLEMLVWTWGNYWRFDLDTGVALGYFQDVV